MDAARWEVGSEFHLLVQREPEGEPDGEPDGQSGPPPPPPWGERGRLLGSGRDALRVLIAHGQRAHGWWRLWLPSYLCPEVVAAAHATGIAVRRYPCVPFTAAAPPAGRVGAGEALLRVEYFGLGATPPLPACDAGAQLIEDHTHDPLSPRAGASRADYCLASLRKTLPLPDGGVLWSPAGHPLPAAPPVSEAHLALAAQKLCAMALKALYLAGGAVDKERYRWLSQDAEARLGAGAASGMSEPAQALLASLPAARWREQRRANHQLLSAALAGIPGVEVAAAQDPAQCSPLGVLLRFASPGLREQVRHALIAARIYPAVLWPLGEGAEVGPAERALSRTLLSLPCDMRYGPQALARVAEQVRAAALAPGARSAAP